jgi:signal transduction histidine kinase/CheY-like chemotaxis protein
MIPTTRVGRLMALMVLVLTAIFGGIGWLQTQSLALLNAKVVYQGDNIVWSFFQLETESLRLGQALRAAAVQPDPTAPVFLDAMEALNERYEIFVSRISLVEPERTRDVMPELDQHRWVIARLHALVARMDQVIGSDAPRQVDSASIRALLPEFDAAVQSIRDFSLLANQALAEGVTRRNEAVRDQSRIGIGLTIFQCLLIGVFAYVVVRQVRSLEQRRSELEQLARHLQDARAEAERASRAKSAFLANMSHELRTPFNGLLGMLSLLAGSALTVQQRDHLGIARQSGEHLMSLLNDVLDYSKMESGLLDLVAHPTVLSQTVQEVQALMAPLARDKGLQFAADFAVDLPLRVLADAKRIKQILFNLLGNAIKFTDAGQVRLQIDRLPMGEGPAVIRFRISDTGIGMGEDTLAHLFQRFSQGDDSISRRFGGTGLGLEISRTLAEMMGGGISVTSQIGRGSEFTVVLPLPELQDRADVDMPVIETLTVAPVVPSDAPLGNGLWVLVTDDHPVNRQFMQVLLERLGHRVLLATNGEEAVVVVREQVCDLVLMDLHMPVMDGLAAARAMRGLPVPQSRVPIVALTADASPESRERVRAAGMDDFLAKPVQLHDVEEVLRRHFGARAVGGMSPADPAAVSVVAPGATVAGPAKPERRRRVRIKPGEAAQRLDMVLIADTCMALSVQSYGALLAGFLSDDSASLADLLALLEPGGVAADRSAAAHRFKGAAASLGLRELADTACAIEMDAGALTQETAALAAQCLRTQFAAAREITSRLGWLGV